MPHLTSVLVRLAGSPSPSPSPSGPPDDMVSPGLLGFVFWVFLGVAVFLLARGLTKQLKRVDFDERAVNGEPPLEPVVEDAPGAALPASPASPRPASAPPAAPTVAPTSATGTEPAPGSSA